MQIIRLEKDQLKYFADMDPFNISEKLEFNNYFAVGALVHNKAKNVDIPMGLMICSLIEQGIVVEWICVGEKFRSYGIGEKLLVTAFDLASQIGTGKLFTYINGYSEAFTNSQISYMADRLFSEEYPVLGEWRATVDEIKEKVGESEGEHKIISIEKLSGNALIVSFTDFALLDNTVFNYPFELEDNGFDEKHSFLLFKDTDVSGGLFTKQIAGTIYVTAISIGSVEDGKVLFKAFTDSIRDGVDGKTVVSLSVRQKPKSYDWYEEPEDKVDYQILQKLGDDLFHEKRIDGMYLAASLYKYIYHIGEKVELDVWNDLAYEVLEEIKTT